MKDVLKEIKEHYSQEAKKDKSIADFSVGDTVKVWVTVVETGGTGKEKKDKKKDSGKETKVRQQAFQGVVIKRSGESCEGTFTVRRVSMDVGIERTFPLHGPTVKKVEIIKKGVVRRSKLYYLRGRKGKAAKIKAGTE